MCSRGVLLLSLALTIGASAANVEYCAPAYKCGSKYMLACNHTGAFDPVRCPDNAKMLPMTGELRELFLHEHNSYRNEIAAGEIFAPAAAMATLEWDDEMAHLAEFNVKQCGILYEDTKCLTTGEYWYMDQNIGWEFYLKRKFNPATVYDDIKKNIKRNWFDQHVDCTQADIDSYKPPGVKLILHFGKMMMDRNNRIGCAVSQYENDFGINILFTCNYARRLFCYKPIFRSGAHPGINCSTGMNSRYPFLCSTCERFNVNDYKV